MRPHPSRPHVSELARRVRERHGVLRRLAPEAAALAERVAAGHGDAIQLRSRCVDLRRAVLANAVAEHDLEHFVEERDARATSLAPHLAQMHRQHAEWMRRLAEQGPPAEGWELTLAVMARSVARALLQDLDVTGEWLAELLDPNAGRAA